MSVTRVATAAALVLAAGCLGGMLSEVPMATVSCRTCTNQRVLVGVPFPVSIGFRGGPSGDPGYGYVETTLTCDGVPCAITPLTDTSERTVDVTATAPGQLTVDVVIHDTLLDKTKHERLGPFTVARVDDIQLRCQARTPGQVAWRSCDAPLAVGDDVRLEAVAVEVGTWIAGLEVPITSPESRLYLRCAPRGLATEATGTATVCVVRDVIAGSHPIVAELAGVRRELTLTVIGPEPAPPAQAPGTAGDY